METDNDTLRDRLLAQVEPDPGRLARYREEVRTMLEQQEVTLRRQKWYAGASWVFAVALTTVFMVFGGVWGHAPEWFLPYVLGLVLMLSGAVELIKYFLNRSRLELLKEIKGLELQVRELKDELVRH